MFALSTAWNAENASGGRALAEEIVGLGINKIELNFSLTATMVEEIFQFCRQHSIEITSLHNFCPIPPNLSRKQALPDCYSLSALDENERDQAVLYTKKTIDTAKKVSAKAVVLHTGRIEIEDKTRLLIELYNANKKDSASYKNIFSSFVKERREKRAPYLAQIIKSLETLSDHAESRGIALGIENRFYYREIPSFEEYDILFTKFKDRPVFFWLDVGHNFIFEKLGFTNPLELLNAYGSRLLGIHLHNIKKLVDHQAPCDGDFDFNTLKPYVSPQTLLVIEAHQQASGQDIKKSVKYLTEVFS